MKKKILISWVLIIGLAANGMAETKVKVQSKKSSTPTSGSTSSKDKTKVKLKRFGIATESGPSTQGGVAPAKVGTGASGSGVTSDPKGFMGQKNKGGSTLGGGGGSGSGADGESGPPDDQKPCYKVKKKDGSGLFDFVDDMGNAIDAAAAAASGQKCIEIDGDQVISGMKTLVEIEEGFQKCMNDCCLTPGHTSQFCLTGTRSGCQRQYKTIMDIIPNEHKDCGYYIAKKAAEATKKVKDNTTSPW